jgi:hypothetical protein
MEAPIAECLESARIHFALNRRIGFTALAASTAFRSRPQSTMLTIIAGKLSAAGWSWAIAVLSHATVGAGYQQ